MSDEPRIKCDVCYFSAFLWPDNESTQRECRHLSPQVVVIIESQTVGQVYIVESKVVTRWPQVNDDDSCGKFRDKKYRNIEGILLEQEMKRINETMAEPGVEIPKDSKTVGKKTLKEAMAPIFEKHRKEAGEMDWDTKIGPCSGWGKD